MRAAVIFCALSLAAGGPVAPPEYDTIVVGVGAAGAACAARLARGGRRVLALEGAPRIGGRVHTAAIGGEHVEMGAEWIHGTEGSSTYKLALENNVTILPTPVDSQMFWSNGSAADTGLIEELMSYCLALADEPPSQPEPVGQYITRRLRAHLAANYPALSNNTQFLTAFLTFMEEVVNGYEASDSWDDVTTDSAYQELGGNQLMSWHRHGYNTLLDILLNTYKGGPGYPGLTIKLNEEVTRVEWGGAGVIVTTAGGPEYRAARAVVTVSVGVLKERHETLFSPPLPPEKVAAINAIGFGVVAKVTLKFPSRWCNTSFCGVLWGDVAGVPEGDRWITRTEGVSVPMQCEDCGTLWLSGERAKLVETLPEEELKQKVMWLIRKYMGPTVHVPDPTDIIRSTWYSNKLTRGTYSYDSVATAALPGARAALAAPLPPGRSPRLMFAGEATDVIHFSTVHGAVDSGVREAERILNDK